MKAKNFKEAALMSLNERWYPMSETKDLAEIDKIYKKTKCELCELQKRRGHISNIWFPETVQCGNCPMDTRKPRSRSTCCSWGWKKWQLIRSSYCLDTGYEKEHRAIMVVVRELEAIAGVEK